MRTDPQPKRQPERPSDTRPPQIHDPDPEPDRVPVEPQVVDRTRRVAAPGMQTKEGRANHPPTPRHTKLVKYKNVNGQEVEIWE